MENNKNEKSPLFVDLDKEYRDITFITGCFNLQNKVSSEDKHSGRSYIDFYCKSVLRLKQKFHNLVVLCDKECGDYLKENGYSDAVVLNYDDLSRSKKRSEYEQIFNKMTKFPSVLKYRNHFVLGLKKSRDSCKNYSLYATIVNSKFDIMRLAVKLGNISSKYICWLDAGSASENYIESLWKNWNGLISRYPISGKMRCKCPLSLSKDFSMRQLKRTTLKDAAFCRRPPSF